MFTDSPTVFSHYKVAAAAAFARVRHDGQFRDSGDEFYTHPLSVALLVAHAGVRNPDIVAAALLHDVGDKKVAGYEEIEKQFGATVADMVTELTDAPSSIEVKHNSQVERVGRLSAGALAINIADNVHNRATIRYKADPERRQRIADKIRRIADEARASPDKAVRVLVRVHDRGALGLDDDLGEMKPANVRRFVARARVDLRSEGWQEWFRRASAVFNVANYPKLRSLYAGAGNRPPEL